MITSKLFSRCLAIAFLFAFNFAFAQPSSFNYKAVVKDSNGDVVSNDPVTVQFQVLQGVGLTNVYQETHVPLTDSNGVMVVNIGEGSVDSGNFSSIIWGDEDYFLNVQLDIGNGLTDLGTTAFKAVPYALHSERTDSAFETFKIEIPNSNALYTSNGELVSTVPTWTQNFSDGSGNEIKIIAVPERKELTLEELESRVTFVDIETKRYKDIKRLMDAGVDKKTAYEMTFGDNATDPIVGTRTGMNEEEIVTPVATGDAGKFTTSVVNPDGTNNTEPMKVTWEPDQKTKTTENEEAIVHFVTNPYTQIFDDGANQIFQLYDPTSKVIRFESTLGIVTVQVQGDLTVNGILSKLAGTFKIDHPLDPYNKYLSHSFVESPDMMNVYNGNITTDENGMASIELPSYFEALNKDFRYQLTCIGTFAQAIVKDKVNNNRFSIQTNKPNTEVSWQVTGIRKDSFAEENRVQVETYKEPENIGTLLYEPKTSN